MKTTVLESECFTPECKGITHSSLITSSLAEVSRILPTSNSLQVSEAALEKKIGLGKIFQESNALVVKLAEFRIECCRFSKISLYLSTGTDNLFNIDE